MDNNTQTSEESSESFSRPFHASPDQIMPEFKAWITDQFPRLLSYAVGALENYPEFEERLPEIHRTMMTIVNVDNDLYSNPTIPMLRRPDGGEERLPIVKEGQREYAQYLYSWLSSIRYH